MPLYDADKHSKCYTTSPKSRTYSETARSDMFFQVFDKARCSDLDVGNFVLVEEISEDGKSSVNAISRRFLPMIAILYTVTPAPLFACEHQERSLNSLSCLHIYRLSFRSSRVSSCDASFDFDDFDEV